MIYELRTYWAASGKRDALHARFRTLTCHLFVQHGMQLVGFWVPDPPTGETGDLVYLLAFPDQDARTRSWEGFRTDAEWQAGKAQSEVEGPLTAKVTSVLLRPTDYSPLQ
jgi:hypothetical protein